MAGTMPLITDMLPPVLWYSAIVAIGRHSREPCTSASAAADGAVRSVGPLTHPPWRATRADRAHGSDCR